MIRTPQDTSLTLAEAAEFLRCSPNTLRSLARQGKVGFKVGKEYGFLVSQLVEYAKLCTSINEMASGGSQFGIARKRLEKVLEQSPNAKPIN